MGRRKPPCAVMPADIPFVGSAYRQFVFAIAPGVPVGTLGGPTHKLLPSGGLRDVSARSFPDRANLCASFRLHGASRRNRCRPRTNCPQSRFGMNNQCVQSGHPIVSVRLVAHHVPLSGVVVRALLRQFGCFIAPLVRQELQGFSHGVEHPFIVRQLMRPFRRSAHYPMFRYWRDFWRNVYLAP